ncbi:MAG: hypothetical protein ACW98K_11885, partial [Candidatus Kariarchaeaceae archaeon]
FRIQRLIVIYLIMICAFLPLLDPTNSFAVVVAKKSLNLSQVQTYDVSLIDKANSVIQTSDGGFVLAGFSISGTFSMVSFSSLLVKTDNEGKMLWNKTLSENRYRDVANDVIQTSNGELVFGGGNGDIFLYVTDTEGNYQWSITYGNEGDDSVHNLVETVDGGFALGGFIGIQNKENDTWPRDFILLKADNDGNIEWNRTYGGENDETTYSLIQTSDGGFALAGSTASFGSDDEDAWFVKTEKDGVLEWDLIFDGRGDEKIYQLLETTTGGYILIGSTSDRRYNTTNDTWEGGIGMLMLKILDNGSIQWNSTYGYPRTEVFDLVETDDGGFLICGLTKNLTSTYQYTDALLIKTDNEGTVQWEKTYGRERYDDARRVIMTDDGGFVFAGSTTIPNSSIEPIEWDQDMWLVKINESGDIQWDRSYGRVTVGTIHPPRIPLENPELSFYRLMTLLLFLVIVIFIINRNKIKRAISKRRRSYAKLYPKR